MNPRNLTPTIDAPAADEPQTWQICGDGKTCAFCGSNQVAATCGCPEEDGHPGVYNVGICLPCLADTVMRRWSEVKHARIARLGYGMRDAVLEIRDARKRAASAKSKRQHGYVDDNDKWRKPVEFDPDVEAEAARRLAEEEAAIARRNWSATEENPRGGEGVNDPANRKSGLVLSAASSGLGPAHR